VTVLDAIPTALGIAEDAILDALNALAPTGSAAWNTHPPETVAALTMPQTGASRLTRLYTAQHQDGGGQPSPFVGARFWTGLVLVKVFARTQASAQEGINQAHAAMLDMTSPAGYSLSARVERPIDLPREITPRRALLYRVTVRRLS
jgi:hypothetical protein